MFFVLISVLLLMQNARLGLGLLILKYRERLVGYCREWRKRRWRDDPEYRKRTTAYNVRQGKRRKRQDPAYHERVKEKGRQWWRGYVERETEEHREQRLAKNREYMRVRLADPAYRNKVNAAKRTRYAAAKAAA